MVSSEEKEEGEEEEVKEKGALAGEASALGLLFVPRSSRVAVVAVAAVAVALAAAVAACSRRSNHPLSLATSS